MIDALATLAPETGLALSCTMVAPDREVGQHLWVAAVDVGLSRVRECGGLDLVGAGGYRRGETVLRAAGEAVERAALVPPPVDPLGRRPVPPGHPARMAVGTPGVARALPELEELTVDCLPALDLSDPGRPAPVLLPACLVDDPVTAQRACVDPGPTGTAAGPTLGFAVERALLEDVERDAVQTGWALRRAVRVRQLRDVVGGAGRGGSAAAAALLDGERVLAAAGLSTDLVEFPADVPGVSVVLALLRDADRDLVAAGACATWSAGAASATAVREALQVYALLRGLTPAAERAVVDEASRAAYWCSSGSVDRATAWLDDLCAICPAGQEPHPRVGVGVHERVHHLAGALARRGRRPVVCDLTARLPPRVRELGWHAVKGVVLGSQQLRMSEVPEHTWNLPRLRGLLAGDADGVYREAPLDRMPHPLV